MHNMPEILWGTIALDYAETLRKFEASDKDKEKEQEDTCGKSCSVPADSGKEKEKMSCPALPEKPYARTFQPVVQGWSEPPAARV
jgi:hypothetical protein